MFELKKTLATEAAAALYVTHDQAEAFALSSRVLILKAGEKVQEGTPEAVYARPRSSRSLSSEPGGGRGERGPSQ